MKCAKYFILSLFFFLAGCSEFKNQLLQPVENLVSEKEMGLLNK